MWPTQHDRKQSLSLSIGQLAIILEHLPRRDSHLERNFLTALSDGGSVRPEAVPETVVNEFDLHQFGRLPGTRGAEVHHRNSGNDGRRI